jgi:hypothetical protein
MHKLKNENLTTTTVKSNGAIEQMTNRPSSTDLAYSIRMFETDTSVRQTVAPDVEVLRNLKRESFSENQMREQ